MASAAAVYFKNGIGNFLLMTPAIKALSHFYGSTVDLVLDSNWNDYRKPVIEHMASEWETIGKVITFPQQAFNPDKYKCLFTTHHCHPSQAGNLFTQKTKLAIEPANWINEYYHEIEYYMRHVYQVGYEDVTPSVYVPVENTVKIPKTNKTIAIYNGAAVLSQRYRWERKRWDKFEKLTEELHNYYGADIIILGGKSESEEGELLSGKYKHIKSYAGKLSFSESVGVLSQCDLMISTDSALMHTAQVVDVPIVAMFGSTMVSKNGPYKGISKIVRGKCQYAPCQYRTQFYLCSNYKCMTSITVSDVIKAVRELGVL